MESISYEQALKELQTIVKELQGESVSMDNLLEKVKRAAFLLDFCKTKLKHTDQEIGELFS